MNGDRMTPEQARASLGQQFAGQVHAGTGNGPFVTGRIIGYSDKPSIIVEQSDGSRESYVVDCIRDWASGPPPQRPRLPGKHVRG